MGILENKSLAEEGDVQAETIQETPFKLDVETARKHAEAALSIFEQRMALGMISSSYKNIKEGISS